MQIHQGAGQHCAAGHGSTLHGAGQMQAGSRGGLLCELLRGRQGSRGRAGGIRAGKAGGAGAGRARLWYGGQAGLEQGELDMGRGGMQCELMQGHRGVSAADVSHRASLYAKLGVLLDHDL